MVHRIAIIGIGTLGGFVAHTLSELDGVEKLILIDFDIVEEKNLINSIYRINDIGQYKTTALYNIIKEQREIEIEIITEKYNEFETVIPEVDIVIDCRDFICNRGNKINVKLYISSRYLIIDCRKNLRYEDEYKGRYLTYLTKNDLRRASMIFSTYIQDGFINYLMVNQIIKEIDLDYLNKISNDIRNKNEERMIIDCDNIDHSKLLNLDDSVDTIIEENNHKDLMISLGDKNTSNLMKRIPRNSIKNINDVVRVISGMNISNQYYYIISMTNECNIELLKESGAA